MNDAAIFWAGELARATAVVAISALVVTAAMRIMNIASPRAWRAAGCLVLVQGWLVIHPRIEVPWGEAEPAGPRELVASGAPQIPQRTETSAPRNIARAEPREASPSSAAAGVDQPTASQTLAVVEPRTALAAGAPSGNPWTAAIARGLLCVWAAGIAAAAAALVASYWRFLREIGVSQPLAPEWRDEWRQALAEQGGLRRIELLVTAGVGPLVCWTPRGRRVLVPEELWRELNSLQRLAVLRHELAHCRRGDLWKSLAVRLLAAPHWFNPFAWRAVRWFDEAAEWACDALAQRTEEERLEYAKALLRLCHCRASSRSLAAAAGGRRVAARLERMLSPPSAPDGLFRKLALAACSAALLLGALVRVELVARAAEANAAAETGDEAAQDKQAKQDTPAKATDKGAKAGGAPAADRKAPTEIDASFIEMLARREAKFAICRVEYVTWEDKGESPPAEERRVEFARDGRGRWLRKENEFKGGVRTRQYEFYVEQDGKRAISVSQHNWNGLNPPQVHIDQPRPESRHAYDATPLFGLFPQDKPLSSMLQDQEVNVEVVDGDARLQWARQVANFALRYEVRLSTEHDFAPVEVKYSLNGETVSHWQAAQLKQVGDVWYAVEGEFFNRPRRYAFKTTRFELGKPLPEAAMRYEIPDGAWVIDDIAGKQFTQGRVETKRTKPLKVTIRDVNDQPIAGATVNIRLNRSSRDEAGKEALEMLTDAEGLANFKAAPDNVLYLQASKAGMRPSSIILGDGQELTMYLTPRTAGKVVDAAGRALPNSFVHTVIQGIEMSQGVIKSVPTASRDSAAAGADGAYEFTQDLTLRRVSDPLMFVAYADDGRLMAIRTVKPQELTSPLDFVLQPAAEVAAEFELPPGAPATTQIGALWTDSEGRRIAYSQAEMPRDAATDSHRGKMIGRFSPGRYQLHVHGTSETEPSVVDFIVRPKQTKVSLDVIPLEPSKFASLRGHAAPELSATPMPPSELKPLSELRGQVVVLNFWHWLGEKLNDHPEQTPFFTLPARYKDQPVYWIAIHHHRVLEPDALAAKVASMRKALWGDGPAPFASLVDQSEPAPPVAGAPARTAVEAGVPGPTRDVTRTRYGIAYRSLVLIDRQGRVVGCYDDAELEPALKRLLEADR